MFAVARRTRVPVVGLWLLPATAFRWTRGHTATSLSPVVLAGLWRSAARRVSATTLGLCHWRPEHPPAELVERWCSRVVTLPRDVVAMWRSELGLRVPVSEPLSLWMPAPLRMPRRPLLAGRWLCGAATHVLVLVVTLLS